MLSFFSFTMNTPNVSDIFNFKALFTCYIEMESFSEATKYIISQWANK